MLACARVYVWCVCLFVRACVCLTASLLQVITVFADEGKVGVELLDSGLIPPPSIKVKIESAPNIHTLVSL